MSNPQQAFLPVAWLGTYSFKVAPKSIQSDQETVVWPHQIIGAHEATEPTGYTAKKLTVSGYLLSNDSAALLDYLEIAGDSQGTGVAPASADGYKNRPCAIGFFDQDSSGASSSQLWYSGVGYLTNIHFEYQGGYGVYKYPYRFNWIEAFPLVRIPTSTPIAQGTTTYSFSVSTNCSGWLAAVELVGNDVGTVGNALQSLSVYDPSSALIGAGPYLGVGSQRLFGGNPNIALLGTGNRPSLMWPLYDENGVVGYNQSVRLTAPITAQTYTVTFGASFATGNLPSAINLIFVQV